MLTRRRIATAVLAAGTSVALVAGCGGSSSAGGSANESSAAPKTELVDSFHALARNSGLTTTLALDATTADLLHLAKQSGSAAITSRQASALSSARISVEERTTDGEALSQASAGDVDVKIVGSASGTTYLIGVETGKTFYLQLDLKDLLGLAGKSSEYQTLVVRAKSLPAFVRAFVAGKFVSLPNSTVSSIEALINGAGGSSSQAPNGGQLGHAAQSLASAILGDLTVTRATSGSTDVLTIVGNARTLAHDALTTLGSAIPLLSSQVSPGSADQVPNQALQATADVTGGAVSRIGFDLGQFSPHHQASLPLTATFTNSAASIAAPSGATPVNLQDLITFFTAFAGS